MHDPCLGVLPLIHLGGMLMKNTVRYSDSREGDRIEILLGTALAVAGLVVVAFWMVTFGQDFRDLG